MKTRRTFLKKSVLIGASASLPILPDQHTYGRVRKFSDLVLAEIENPTSPVFHKRLTLREFSTYFNPIWWTKLSLDNHYISKQNCVDCGTCVDKCPTGSIDLNSYSINTDTCVLCFGCLNNCEYQAMIMEYNDEKLIGYKEFIKKNQLEF